MTDSNLGREAAVVDVTADAETLLGRETAIVAHLFATEDIDLLLGRMAIIVCISRPLGWD